MNFEMPNFALALPELFVLCMACIVLLVDLFVGERNRFVTYLMAQATLVGAMVLTLGLATSEAQYTFGGSFVRDAMGDVLKAFIYLATLMVFVYSRDYLRAPAVQRRIFCAGFVWCVRHDDNGISAQPADPLSWIGIIVAVLVCHGGIAA
jgi:NADH:ubiquinone oxidoreductase subunit 2 (subunit N)